MLLRSLFTFALSMALWVQVSADEHVRYAPGRVVYDLSSGEAGIIGRLLDRAVELQRLYGNDPFDASIVIVIHEDAVPLFAGDHAGNHPELVRRASGLAMGEVIEFRLCRLSARMQGLDREDFQEFITMVPMADAELVRLQREGYAYLR